MWIHETPENLEDDDLLEMVNAGLITITIVDDYLADFWKQVLTKLTVHDTVAVQTGGNLAVAIRKGSPQLARAQRHHRQVRLQTSFGNMMQKRYLQSTKYVKDATSEAEHDKFLAMTDLFKKYSDQYGMDYLLMAAQGFQESGLGQSFKSRVGAVGVMQVMPATGKELNVGDISQLEANIHAGVKYMRWIVDEYYKDERWTRSTRDSSRSLPTTPGPGTSASSGKRRRSAASIPMCGSGTSSKSLGGIGRETVTYVSNIYKYYVAYRLVVEEKERRAGSKKALESASSKKSN